MFLQHFPRKKLIFSPFSFAEVQRTVTQSPQLQFCDPVTFQLCTKVKEHYPFGNQVFSFPFWFGLPRISEKLNICADVRFLYLSTM